MVHKFVAQVHTCGSQIDIITDITGSMTVYIYVRVNTGCTYHMYVFLCYCTSFQLTVARFWVCSIRREAVPVVTCGVSVGIGFWFLDSSTGSPHSRVPSCSGSWRNLSHSWAACSLSHLPTLGCLLQGLPSPSSVWWAPRCQVCQI